MLSLKADTWASVLRDIKDNVGEQRFSLWFSNVRPVKLEGNTVILGVPNLFVQDWLSTHFRGVLHESVARQLGKGAEVSFVIDPKLFRKARTRSLEAGADIVAAGAADAAGAGGDGVHIRSDFTLKNFVVGPCNKLAHACALEILESSSNRLHPLFVHSRSGLGKTHLLQSVWHEINRQGKGRKAVYVSAETFTNEFVYAVRSQRMDGFRHRYRNADILLIDDVHFLNKKRGLQEELLHTYDALESRKRQLVLASDVHPKMLMQVKQGLVNRFASGMIVRISQPDVATRQAILKAKARLMGRDFPEGVLKYISRVFNRNMRELTGAMTTVAAYASLTGGKVDCALARKALLKMRPAVGGSSGLEAIEKIVAKHFGTRPGAWRAPRLTRAVRFSRQVCMYLARKCSTVSCREIAAHFDLSNHSTVTFAVKRVEEEMKKDIHLPELVAAMAEAIRRG